MPTDIAIGPVTVEELVPALRLVFQHLLPRERESRVANALTLVAAGELTVDGIFVARRQAGVWGALVSAPLRGAGGLVWPPQVLPGPDADACADALVIHAKSWLRQRGAKVVQALLVAEELPFAGPLARNGLQHVTTLLYLRRPSQDATPTSARAAIRLEYITYADCDRALFRATLGRTYEGTRDCPELDGVRTWEEVVEGHQAQGRFDPRRWWLARLGGEAAGVLLLNEMPDWNSWDMAYVGVVPEARRRGVGLALVRKALDETRLAGRNQVTLAVDARNQPARHIYDSLGFERFDERTVFLCLEPKTEARLR
jgi:ribosomal protein S18 acetylase RimI-like enzyme